MEIPKFKIESKKSKSGKVKNKIVFDEEMPKDLLTYLNKNCGLESNYISEKMLGGILSGLMKMGKLEKTDKGWETSIIV